MSSSTADVLYNTVWIDYDQPILLGPRILVAEWWATFWVSALSVWAAIWAAKYWDSIVDKENGIIKERNKISDRVAAAPEPATNPAIEPSVLELAHFRTPHTEEESQPLAEPVTVILGSRGPDSAAWKALREIVKILKQSVITLGGSASNFTLKQKLKNFWQNIINNFKQLLDLGFLLIFSASIFLALSIGATFVSYLQSDNIALSASPTCGDWIHNQSTRNMVYAWNMAEEQAASYYRGCYEADPSVQLCNIYANNDPLSQRTDNTDCPFLGDVCLLGPKSAVTFDTGYLDVNTLGINARNRPFYRRRTTCAPVVTDGYVEFQDNYSGFLIQAQFYYGTRDRGPTYAQSRIFSLPGTSSPTYQVAVKVSGRDFTPLPEFTSPNGGHTVLLFVTSFNVQHPVRSDDPIFPFRTQIKHDPTGNPDLDEMLNYWTNEERYGAVLGCVEHAELCKDASIASCFDPWKDNRPVSTLDDETYATGIGLLYSGHWASINTRTSKELDATRKIVDIWISQPLDEEQWKLEAHRMFESLMIRARLEVLELARGTRSRIPHFKDRMLDIHRGVCKKIKFQAAGYKNLSVAGLLFTFLFPPILAFRIKKFPIFYWPIYSLWKLARIPIKDMPLALWPWMGIKKVGRLLSKVTPPVLDFFSTATNMVWDSLKVLYRVLRFIVRVIYDFLSGFNVGVHRSIRFVNRVRSGAGQRQDSISLSSEP